MIMARLPWLNVIRGSPRGSAYTCLRPGSRDQFLPLLQIGGFQPAAWHSYVVACGADAVLPPDLVDGPAGVRRPENYDDCGQ